MESKRFIPYEQWGTCSAMNNSQDNWPLAGAERKEISSDNWLNHLSSAVHSGLSKVISNLRFSLTLRISMHYAGKMLKTTFLAAVLLMMALCIVEISSAKEVRDQLSNIQPAAGGVYSEEQLIHMPVSAAWIVNDELWDDARGWNEKASLFFSKWNEYPERCVVICFETQAGWMFAAYQVEKLIHTMQTVFWVWIVFEVYRMMQFIFTRKQLEPLVVQPIRDMTETAEAVSGSNLSDRISVEGAKNELKDLALVINQMLDRIEVSYNSQKQFVSDASHELRTPIAVIQGYVNMLQRWGKTDREVLEEGISAIEQEAASMKELVERLLFLARHDKKTLMLEMESFDPLEILSEVHREAKMLSSDHLFELSPVQPVTVCGDKDMIKQLMRILVDNAIKYTPAGGSITLGVRREKSQCILSVTDTGAGISAEELPKVFERFYRCDEARKSQTSGHGLGLSIARIIVASHGGKLKVRSKVGAGTTFSVWLPLDRAIE